jgi:hypothetical protein
MSCRSESAVISEHCWRLGIIEVVQYRADGLYEGDVVYGDAMMAATRFKM